MEDRGGVALVTGGGRGIGRRIAVALAEEGYRLGLTARSDAELSETAELVAEAGSKAVAVTGDVAAPADVDRVCATVEERLGRIEVLVNNAGYFGEFGTFAESDPETWWRVLETNVRGPMLFCRRILPSMMDAGRGYIININSRAAVWNDPGGSGSAYSVSKAALSRLTAALAMEAGDRGVFVADLSPGMVHTSMTEQRPDFDDLPTEAFTPVTAAAETVVALVSGRYDVLHGRFVWARDDLDELAARAAADPRARTLAFRAAGPGDPLG